MFVEDGTKRVFSNKTIAGHQLGSIHVTYHIPFACSTGDIGKANVAWADTLSWQACRPIWDYFPITEA
jgi:hypothetical protein